MANQPIRTDYLCIAHAHQVIEFSRVFTHMHMPRVHTPVHTPNWRFPSLRGPPNFHTRGIYTRGSLYIRGQTVRGPGKGPRKDKMSSVVWSNATTSSSVCLRYKYTHTHTHTGMLWFTASSKRIRSIYKVSQKTRPFITPVCDDAKNDLCISVQCIIWSKVCVLNFITVKYSLH